MTAVILRRRKLGKGSATGIIAVAKERIAQVRNWKPRDWVGITHVPYVFRWGCTSTLPFSRDHVVNEAKAIHWCGNKRQSRLDMQEAGVPVPQTWGNHYQVPADVGEVVFRPSVHAQGRNLWVVDTNDAGWQEALSFHAAKFPCHYVSRLIDKVAEYRVFVCQNRVSWVAKKTPGNPEDVAWNVAQGGKFENVRWGEWPIKVLQAALKAAKVGGTDFCGVDVMVDRHGKPYVLEANSAPSQTSPYRQSCVAKTFDYIIQNGKEAFPDVHGGTYRDYIHPAVVS